MNVIFWITLMGLTFLTPVYIFHLGNETQNPIIIGMGFLSISLMVITFILIHILDNLEKKS